MKDLDENKIIEILNFYPKTVSLNKKIKENDGSSEIGDFIEDETQENPLEEYIRQETKNLLLSSLNETGLDERTIEIVKLRHGFVDGVEYKLDQIGKRFSITRERVRQILERAYERMKPIVQAKFYGD